jgi:hypothetical protein
MTRATTKRVAVPNSSAPASTPTLPTGNEKPTADEATVVASSSTPRSPRIKGIRELLPEEYGKAL